METLRRELHAEEMTGNGLAVNPPKRSPSTACTGLPHSALIGPSLTATCHSVFGCYHWKPWSFLNIKRESSDSGIKGAQGM